MKGMHKLIESVTFEAKGIPTINCAQCGCRIGDMATMQPMSDGWICCNQSLVTGKICMSTEWREGTRDLIDHYQVSNKPVIIAPKSLIAPAKKEEASDGPMPNMGERRKARNKKHRALVRKRAKGL